MTLFAIRRDVGPMTSNEMDAAVFRAIVCAHEFPGLKWVRSYWDEPEGEVICYYEAVDEEQVRLHSFKSNIPCGRVYPVTELTSEGYSDAKPDGRLRPVAG